MRLTALAALQLQLLFLLSFGNDFHNLLQFTLLARKPRFGATSGILCVLNTVGGSIGLFYHGLARTWRSGSGRL